jgi:hypothetical protein
MFRKTKTKKKMKTVKIVCLKIFFRTLNLNSLRRVSLSRLTRSLRRSL